MLVQLAEWAKENFSPAPHRNTLINWTRAGYIYPVPVFIGRSYFVEKDARYVGAKQKAPDRPDRKRLSERR